MLPIFSESAIACQNTIIHTLSRQYCITWDVGMHKPTLITTCPSYPLICEMALYPRPSWSLACMGSNVTTHNNCICTEGEPGEEDLCTCTYIHTHMYIHINQNLEANASKMESSGSSNRTAVSTALSNNPICTSRATISSGLTNGPAFIPQT